MILAGRTAWKLLGLIATSSLLPVMGATTLPDEPTAPVSSAPSVETRHETTPQPPSIILVREDAVAADPNPAGYLADYNPSDLNGGSRGFAATSLTVNQTLPAPRAR